jgi:hypothetical protein
MENIAKLFSCISKPKKDPSASFNKSDAAKSAQRVQRGNSAHAMSKMNTPGDHDTPDDPARQLNSTRKI